MAAVNQPPPLPGTTTPPPARDVVGCDFSLQWPSIKRLADSKNLRQYSTKATVGLVSEKYDGSNLAVTSRGVVASRRKVLLCQPSVEELAEYSFQGVGLAKVAGMFEKLKELEIQLKMMLPDIKLEDVVVYGELIQKLSVGKFPYKSRGLEEGDILIFGAGVAFSGEVTPAQLELNLKLLRAQGFDVKGKDQDIDKEGATIAENSQKMAALFLNPTLKKLLKECGFEKELVEQSEVSFPDLAKLYGNMLVTGEIEGVVINFGEEVLKWKGSTEEQHLHMQEIEHARLVIDPHTYETWKAIAEQSMKTEEKSHNKKKPKLVKMVDQTEVALITAYLSALNKRSTMEEHLERGGKLEVYMKELKEEMMKDQPESGKEKETFLKKLPHFIRSEMQKQIGGREDSERLNNVIKQQMTDWMSKKS